jgi:exodeoxyribonuclease V gamma subunit
MPGFHLCRSASTEALAERLVSMVAAPGAPLPLDEDELVVVQGRGMERWLGQRAAARLGVWAGARFPYPRAAAAEMAGRVLQTAGEAAEAGRGAVDRSVLSFAVAAELPALMERPEGARVRAYVGADGARLLSCAQQAAAALDGALVYRPDVLQAWAENRRAEGPAVPEDERWLGALWRALLRRASQRAGEGAPELAQLVEFWPRLARAAGALREGGACPGVTRVSVFAVSGLPPGLIEFYAALAQAIEVHWFAVDPAADTAGSPAAVVAELGASDLESVSVVHEALARARERGVPVHEECLAAPRQGSAPGNGVLARVQRAMREGTAGVRASGAPGEGARDEREREREQDDRTKDRSLRVHACPGAMREAEVLHDELLRAFDELPGLAHEDIVVLVPDIGAYAPVVEAALRGGRGIEGRHGSARLPLSVADLSDRDGSPVAAALGAALRMADGDLGARSAVELLSQPAVAERFAPTGDAAVAAEWLGVAGVRRFVDASHRAAAGLPADDTGTWRAGMDRLLLGLAAPMGSDNAVPGTLAFPAQPFLASAETLAPMLEFVELLEWLRAMAAAGDQPVDAWMVRMREALRRLSPTHGAGEREARALQQELAEIEVAARAAGFNRAVPFAAARSLVEAAMGAGRTGRGFLSGGITVCQFVPMRAVPFRVVCMLGMGDGMFPRASDRSAFDPLAWERRVGDPNPRAEDRALFLQSVLAAADRVVVTYPSLDLATNSARGPSTVVRALLDAAVAVGASDDELTVSHPLHAFSVGAFDAGAVQEDRVGFDARARAAAERLMQGVSDETPVFLDGQGLPTVAPEDVVTLDDLVAFFRDPARQTLASWGVQLSRTADALEDVEPIEASGLATYKLRRALLAAAMQGGGRLSRERSLEVVQRCAREGTVPPGRAGLHAGLEVAEEVRGVLARHAPAGIAMEPVEVRVPATPAVVLRGEVPVSEGAVRVTVATRGHGRDLVEAWIRHLAWCVQRGDGVLTAEGTMLALGGKKDARLALPSVSAQEARERLAALLAIRRLGLERGVPFIPDLSLQVAKIAAATGTGAGLSGAVSLAQADAAKVAREVQGVFADDPGGRAYEFEAARVLFRGLDLATHSFGTIDGVCPARLVDVAVQVFEPLAQPKALGKDGDDE